MSLNPASPSQVKAWCLANGFHPNRTLGQNFLIDLNAREAILDAAGIVPGERILEIGPGLGALTQGLLARGGMVTAVEKDSILAERLPSALGNPQNLSTIAADALDLAKRGELDGFPKMVSNLPYQSGTRILLELTRRLDRSAPGGEDASSGTDALSTIVVMVQTEVAERLAAGPGSKTRGLAGVWTQLDYDVEMVRDVKASCFWPVPQVGSTVIRLVRHHRNDALPAALRDLLRRLVKRAFEHRRKQLGSIFKGIVQSTARAEQLSNDDWIELAKGLIDENA
ncbi:MAG: ribosomal RNA small subunit methyltransferase A [Kiritimatiellae bacterium]|nr:ribosomal RNA small subunit methyltransferase A [Kiritimatiellia bacterium]